MAKGLTVPNLSGKKLPRSLAMALIGVGALVLAVGLWWVYKAFSPSDPDAANRAAQDSIEQISGSLSNVRNALAEPDVIETARALLNDEVGDAGRLRQLLQAAGVANLIDVRVFGPDVESIEIGEYPEPNYAVVQMLLRARRQGSTPAEVHYPGTANENLALARSVSRSENEQDVVAGYLFVRLPVSIVTRRLVDPGSDGWLALQQGETVIAGNRAGAARGPSDGQATIAGSQLRLHWASAADGAPSPTLSGAVAGLGVLLGLLGFMALRSGVDRAASTEATDSASVQVASDSTEAKPKSAQPGEAVAGASGDQQDLPDWMLDDNAADDDGGAFKQPDEDQRASGEMSFDVPDLDEIYEQIESEDGGEQGTPAEALKDEAATSGDESEKEEDPLELEDFDFSHDTIEPDEDEAVSALEDDPLVEEEDLEDDIHSEPEPEPGERPGGEENDGEETRPALDLDFEFSDARKGEEEAEAEPEPDAASADEPGDEGEATAAESTGGDELELALEEDWWTDASTGDSSTETDDEDTFNLDSGLELESDADAGCDSEAESEGQSGAAGEAESGGQPEPGPAPTQTAAAPEAGGEAIDALPSGIFRHHEILGLAEDELDVPTATDIGQAIGTIASERGFSRIAVARDGRFSGPVLLSALIRGLRNGGLDVIEIGAVPTPLLWFAATELAEGCGVMVTASHHPSEYNGFQVMVGGKLIEPEDMAELHRCVSQKAFAEGEGAYEQQHVLERYAKRLTADIQLERPLKVVVDCANGVGGTVVPKLLQAVGAELIPLYCDVDGGFPNHQPDPSSPDQLEDLRLCVRNFQAELGIAFDGDADRLVMVTRNGEIVWPDRLLMLLAEDILAARPDEAVVFDARCSGHLSRVIENAGGRAVMTAAGQQAVVQGLKRANAPLGGDMNGHLIINDRWYPFDDAVYAAARLLEILAADTRSLDEILEDQPVFRVSPEIVVDIDRERSRAIVERLASEADFGDGSLTQVGGLRVDWPDRWVLARVDDDTGRLILRFGADEAAGLGLVRGEFREKLRELEPKLPLPY